MPARWLHWLPLNTTLDDRLIRTWRLILAGCLLAAPLAAQSPDAPEHKTFFVKHDIGLAVGAAALSAGISIFDPRIARFFQDTSLLHVRDGRKLDKAFSHINETTLTLGGLVLYGVGRLAHSALLSDVAFHAAESVAAASLTAQVVRGPLGRTRPLDSKPPFDDQYDFHFGKGFTSFQHRAFPSIHSSSGFAAASAIVAEVHRRDPSATWLVAVPAYALAMTPGLSRMYLGEHWASDIVAGAVLGTFYGWRIVDYSHAHPTTRIDHIFLGNVKQVQVGMGGNGEVVVGWGTVF
jgi:membrane-associated phospholipid phosphatase